MRVTVDQIMKLHPCYTRERVVELWAGRRSLTLREIAALDIWYADRVWALAHLVPHKVFVEWACDCAKRVLPVFEAWAKHTKQPMKIAKAPRRCIATVRRWLRGEVTLAEVRQAQNGAAYATRAAYYVDTKATSAAYAALYTAHYADFAACSPALVAAYAADAAAHQGERSLFYTVSRRKECKEEMYKWLLARLVKRRQVSYIRCGSNPEGLYIIGSQGRGHRWFEVCSHDMLIPLRKMHRACEKWDKDPRDVRSEVRRLRRGVDGIASIVIPAEDVSALLSVAEVTVNLLAGREWSGNGEVR